MRYLKRIAFENAPFTDVTTLFAPSLFISSTEEQTSIGSMRE